MSKFYSKLLKIALAAAMVIPAFAAPKTALATTGHNVEVTVDDANNTVTIGNDYLTRKLSVAEVLKTLEIVNKRADETFTPAQGSEEFVIKFTKEDTGAISLPALSRDGWTAKADSYHNASGDSDGPASNLLDGRTESIWHTNYGGGTGSQAFPYNVLFTLNGEKTFKSFSYTPRQQGEDTNGNILGYELYASNSTETLVADAQGWELVAKGNFAYNGVNPIYVNLDKECTATQLKLVATSAKNGNTFAGGAEFNLHNEFAPVAKDDRSFAAGDLTIDKVEVQETEATINNVEKSGKLVKVTFEPYTFKENKYTIAVNYVMYDGDHFMRKFIEIDSENKDVAIDYIDLESLKVNEGDATWTIPTNQGGVVAMSQFKANLGQPIYIQGMFLGCEFPAADTQIVDGTGYSRYYTGKTFTRLEADKQLTTDGKYVTWQTVLGAARSTENQVIQSDFFEYIYSIATPSEFRTQYNSWFDNMMHIDDENILESFIEVDRELNKVETRPMDSYVVDDGWNNYNNTGIVDASRSGTTLNTTGFWEFNSKFPNALTPSSELVQNFGSNFGVWIGPRGGYNFYGHLADILVKSRKGSKAGGSIDVADRTYVENYKNMAVSWQQDYGVNYWKWDGFADGGQYGHFKAQDGVPGYANRHMTGGYEHMYHVTDLWEAWIDLMEACRADAKTRGVTDLWISLTCYVNPSPWFLQWANSVWMQCVYDQKDAGFGKTKLNKQMTYRDAMYYDFYVNHQFQFPTANLYNHDPIYGKEGTGMNINTATDEDFKNYLYMQSTRGTAFWELYFSDSIMTDGKYEVTGEFLAWAEENHHMLKNSKMIGGQPDNTKLNNGSSSEASADAYGYSCFDGKDGIISLRNPHTSQSKTITFTFDRTMGVAEDAKTLKYHMEHAYNLTEGTATKGELEYGQTYTFTLAPNEVRMLRVSENGDTTAPELVRAYTDGAKTITVRTNEKVNGTLFSVTNTADDTAYAVSKIEKSADGITYRITLKDSVPTETELKVAFLDGKDLAGNAVENTITTVHYVDGIVPTTGLDSNNGFTVSAKASEAAKATLVKQGESYALGVNAEGKAYFTLNGATAVSKNAIEAGDVITGVKENNGILKLYVDGTLVSSAYKAENRYYAVEKEEITAVEGAVVLATALGYDEVETIKDETPTTQESVKVELTADMLSASSTDDTETGVNKSVSNLLDGNNTTFWASHPTKETSLDTTYVQANLGEVKTINKVDLALRYDSNAKFNCTGNIQNYIISVSTDGETWKEVATGNITNGAAEITFEPVQAQYVKVTSTSSYHWQNGTNGQPDNRNKVMCIADLVIYEVASEEGDTTPTNKLDSKDMVVTVPNTGEGDKANIFDGDPTTFWASTVVNAVEKGNPYVQIDLGDDYLVERVDYTKRYYDGPQNQWKCTGNIRKYVVEVSTDGQTWKEVATGSTFDDEGYTSKGDGGTTAITFDPTVARYVRISATETYHWKESELNTVLTVGDVAIYGDVAYTIENIALGQPSGAYWTADDSECPVNPDMPVENGVDGTKVGNYVDFGQDQNTNGSYYEVDLGSVSKVQGINLFRYYADGRTYKNTVIAIAKDKADFKAGNATIIYNTDTNNIHGLGAGTDATYAETAAGKSWTLDELVDARYVRVYMNGTTSGGTTNHIIELEVMGARVKDTTDESDTVDLTNLINILAEAAKLDMTKYTDETAAALEAEVTEGKALLNGEATQEEVEAQVSAIDAAIKALAIRGADYSELDAAIEDAETLDASKYEDFSAVETALKAAKELARDLTVNEQETVDATTKALTDAVAALKAKGADYTALDKAIEDAEKLTAEDYKDFSAVEAALKAAKELARDLTVDEQAKVDAAAKALTDAVAALVEKDAVIEIPTDEMTASTGNAHQGNDTEGPADFAIDNNPNTMWHTDWYPADNAGRDDHWLVITFDELKEINGMKILQRQGQYPNGQILKYDLYGRISEDSEWVLIVDDGELTTSNDWQTVTFDPTEVKEVKLQVLDATGDQPNKAFSAIAEIRFTETGADVEAVADYTKVNEAITKAENYSAEMYNGYDAVEAAIAAVVRGLRVSEQARVDEMAAAIEAAIAALTLKDADYAKVNEALAKVPADLSIYTKESVAKLQAAIDVVVEGYKADKQADVDAMAASIEDAIKALVLKDADYAKVEEALGKVPADLSIYTKESAAKLQAAIDAVVEGLDITKQAEVDGYAKAIEEAIAALELKAADYSAVDEAITKAEALVKENYKDFANVEAAIEAVVEGLDITKQDEVDAMAKAIEEAIAALELKDADYSEVEAIIEIVNRLNKDDYENFEAVEEAIKAVVEGLDITKQAEVDAMADAISEAVANLKVKEDTDVEPKPEPTPDPKPEPELKPEDTVKPEKPEVPGEDDGEEGEDNNVNTSDNTQVFAFIAMMAMAIIAFFTSRKQKED